MYQRQSVMKRGEVPNTSNSSASPLTPKMGMPARTTGSIRSSGLTLAVTACASVSP